MLIEMACADAAGIGFEFVPLEGDTRPNTGRDYYQNPKYLDLEPGHYTDDTQRTLATANVLLDGDPFSIKSYAASYIEVFRDDPRNGYSRRYQAFLESVTDADDFLNRVQTTQESNGALMGVLPVGFLPEPGQVRAAAAAQALATHSYMTVPYAQSLALAAHFYLYRARYHGMDLSSFLEREERWSLDRPYSIRRQDGPVKMSAHDTWAAVLSLTRYDSLTTILRAAIDLRGDTDSVAALAVGIASLDHPNVRNDLSPHLLANLESGNSDQIELLKSTEQRLRDKFKV